MNEADKKVIELTDVFSPEMAGLRLDQALAQLFPQYSRSQLKTWLASGFITVNGQALKPKEKIKGSETVVLTLSLAPAVTWEPQAQPLAIVFEDEQLIVLNKPKNCVVHPGAGNASGTLVNALLHHHPAAADLPRAGIVHRLDKDTTGLMVVAKTSLAYHALVQALQAREVKRMYEAIVCGVPVAGGRISAPIARHPQDRKKMAVVTSNHGKEAVTHYRVLQKFREHAHLELRLETGRTHQIRVHLAYIHYPILGDKTYGGRFKLPPKADPDFQTLLRTFPRQALHAKYLSLVHPVSGETLAWEAHLPADMQQLIQALAEDWTRHAGED